MKRPIGVEQLIELLQGDRELVEMLLEMEILRQDEQGFSARDVDRALTSRTLYRELEVGRAGIEIILRLREELNQVRRELTLHVVERKK
jgi:hypothetical protein